MSEHQDEPGGPKTGLLLLASCGMIACCALPVLIASGGLAAALGWLSGGSGIWLIVALILSAAAFAVLRQKKY